MTQGDLAELISATVKAEAGPTIARAIAGLAAPRGGGIVDKILGASAGKGDATMTTMIDEGLGAYPLGRKLRALALGRLESNTDSVDGVLHALKHAKGWRPTEAEATADWFRKSTLTAGNASAAGNIVAPGFDPEWIALLRQNATIRSVARTIPMPRGATTKRRQTGAATASYQGELGPITPSNLTVGTVNLVYHKLTSLSVVSNDLIRFSGGDADRIVEEDAVAVSALREDRAFLLGNPPADVGSPQGIRYQTSAANVFASAGATLANFQADLAKAVRLVEESGVATDAENSYFILSPATFWTIFNLTSGTGDAVFARGLEMNPPRLMGFRVLKSRALNVSNSWIGANAGMVYFVHAPSLEIHDSLQRTVSVYPGGAYYDPATASVASGISNDESVFVSIAEHDFLQAHPTAASVITGYAT